MERETRDEAQPAGRLQDPDLVLRAKQLRGMLLEEMPAGEGLNELWRDMRQASIWELHTHRHEIITALNILGESGHTLLRWMLRHSELLPGRLNFWRGVNETVLALQRTART